MATQFRRQHRQSVVPILSPAVFDGHGLAFDKTCLLQSPAKSSQGFGGYISRLGVEESNDRHRRLLRARCERPRCHNAEQR
jgi:hypothetical protein